MRQSTPAWSSDHGHPSIVAPATAPAQASPDGRSQRWHARLVLALLLCCLATQVGCGRREEPLRVAVLLWPPYETAILARELGLLDAARVELVDYRSPAVAIRDYRNGVVDVAAVTLNYVLRVAEAEPGQRIVLSIDESIGGDVVMARPEISDIRSLRGRRVGVEASALGAYVLARALEESEMTASDIEVVPVDLSEHEALYRDGQIDAVTTYEPIATRLRGMGAHAIFDSGDLRGEVYDVLVTTADVLERREDDLRHLVTGWLLAVEHFEQDPMGAAAVMSRREPMGPAEFLEILAASAELHDLEDNRRLLTGEASEMRVALRRVYEASRRFGLLAEELELEGMVTDLLLSPEDVR